MAFLVLNRMEGEFNVVRVESSDVPVYTHVQTPQSVYLDIKFVVKPVNVMYGEYEILERPRIKKTYYPIRDSYVYEAVPALNYGGRTAFHIGKDDQGKRYRSLIDFDIGDLKEDLYITHAELILTTTDILYNLRHFEISTLNKPFYEYGVTWLNQPTRDQFVDIIQVEPLQKQIKINVTDAVKQWYLGERAGYGFVLKEFENIAGEVLSFYSKEYGIDVCPRLEIEYLDPDFGVPNYNSIPIQAKIQRNKHRDLLVKTNIKRIYDDSDLGVELFVHNRQELVINSFICKRALPIQSNIIKYTKSHLLIESRVQQKKAVDLDIEAYITKANLPIQYAVISHSNIPINAIITKHNLPANVIVNKKTLPINIHIKDHNDLPIFLNVSRKQLNIVVNTIKSNSLLITSRIRGRRKADLPIILGLRRPDIDLMVDTILSSSLGIQAETIGFKELPIRSRVQYSGFRSLDIQSDIIGNSMLPIQVDIKSAYFDIGTHIQLPRSNFLPIKVDVLQHSDLEIKFEVVKSNALPIFVDIEHIWFSDLGITFTVDGEVVKRAYVFIF